MLNPHHRPPTASVQYVVFYDGCCAFCRRSRHWIERLTPGLAMRWIDANDHAELSRWPQIDPDATKTQLFVLDPAGRVYGGYDAIVELLLHATGPLRPLLPTLRSEWSRRAGRRLYRWVAKHRNLLSWAMALE